MSVLTSPIPPTRALARPADEKPIAATIVLTSKVLLPKRLSTHDSRMKPKVATERMVSVCDQTFRRILISTLSTRLLMRITTVSTFLRDGRLECLPGIPCLTRIRRPILFWGQEWRVGWHLGRLGALGLVTVTCRIPARPGPRRASIGLSRQSPGTALPRQGPRRRVRDDRGVPLAGQQVASPSIGEPAVTAKSIGLQPRRTPSCAPTRSGGVGHGRPRGDEPNSRRSAVGDGFKRGSSTEWRLRAGTG